VGGQLHAPAALHPGMTQYPLYGRLGGLQSRSRRVRKISPPPGFDPRTVHPVASHYTDCVIPAHSRAVDVLHNASTSKKFPFVPLGTELRGIQWDAFEGHAKQTRAERRTDTPRITQLQAYAILQKEPKKYILLKLTHNFSLQQ
jgi:hypothetical protein